MSAIADNRSRCTAWPAEQPNGWAAENPIEDAEWLSELARNFVFNDLSYRSGQGDHHQSPL